MISLPFRTLCSLGGIVALFTALSFVPRHINAQGADEIKDAVQGALQAQKDEFKDAMRSALQAQRPERAKTNRTVADALAAGKQYTTFLAIAERAGLTSLLKGTATDSTKPEIAFVEDSVGSGMELTTNKIEVEGEVPEGINITQLKSDIADHIRDAMGELMTEIIAEPGKITVFAPNDAAFAKLPQATLDSLKTDSVAAATFIRTYVVNRGVYRDALGKIRTMASLGGANLAVGAKTGNVATINGIAVSESDVAGDNGVAHGLEAVLDPKAAPAPASNK